MLKPKSFRVGQRGEDYVRGLLSSAGVLLKPKAKESLHWDIEAEIAGIEFRAEVKFDQMEAWTGKVALEYRNNYQDAPSGILATTSDLWCMVLQNPMAAFVVDVETLRHFFHAVEPAGDLDGGDNGRAKMRLFWSKEILEIFKPMDVGGWELHETILSLLTSSFALS